LATLPWWASDRWVSIGYTTFITAVAVIGLQICTGYAGQINLGQSARFLATAKSLEVDETGASFDQALSAAAGMRA